MFWGIEVHLSYIRGLALSSAPGLRGFREALSGAACCVNESLLGAGLLRLHLLERAFKVERFSKTSYPSSQRKENEKLLDS